MRLGHHLKHWFVPHKHNDHKPHLIRKHGLAAVAVLIVGIQLMAFAVRPPDVRVLAYASNITPVDLLTQTNQQRAANGLPALKLDSRLNASSLAKAQNMFAEDYWAHVSPSGIQPWYWFTQAGYAYTYAGENLAKDFDTTTGVMDGWMNSPGHRANILNVNYKDVGFAVLNGTLLGSQTTLVVAHYGSTASAPLAAAPAPSSTPRVAAVNTPVPTPLPATPTPVATPVPTPLPSPMAVPTALQPNGGSAPTPAPAAKAYSFFLPLSLAHTLSWGTLVTLVLLLVLLFVYVLTHITVWRKGLKRWQDHGYRGLALAQISALSLIILYLAVSGFGRVG